ncbi:flavocytochrome c [Alkaliphilus metalliredigens QYMF]|uniref:Urocanate reductase n=1 Tax=Alkaliphilus metalliredigens (strain QYMF) TaxID=293826 RepID=A6TLB6_ALKMQ|nr:flavocytochrome c [Alkaliphilus metalliredigens]ABR46984.1 flavocytochrome c [Alkaliphilus metalliredigens QYMF]
MMRKTKKMLAILMILAMFFTVVGCSETTDAPASGEGLYTAGTYVGEGEGFAGLIKVEVTVDENEIQEIKILEHNESAGISDSSIANIPTKIVEYQSLNIDTISGATGTGAGILEAVEAALVLAGADIEALKQAKGEDTASGEIIEKEADVIVIGGGGAGLAAAVSASEEGASVILIEKLPMLGGNTIRSGGALNVVYPERQERQGIEDSVDKHFEDTYQGGDELGNPELIRTLVENAYPALRWLEDKGLELQDEVFTVLGALWPRSHESVDPLGSGFIRVLQTEAEKNGVEILMETAAEELIIEDGRVVGVLATSKGNTVTLKANKGVIMATGGFAANVDMRVRYNPDLGANLQTTNSPGATGDGIIMGEAVDANLLGMDYIQSLPLGDPETGSLTGWAGNDAANYLFINKEGNRFVSEAGRRDVMTNGLIEQTDSFMHIVVDSQSMPDGSKNHFNETIEDLVERGQTLKAMSLEELAEKMNVDVDNFTETIAKYNEAVDTGVDEFEKHLLDKKIDQAPFYASPRVPTAHHTMGGLEINNEAQVIDINGNVIPGFYAAGEVTGGIHGSNRLGGNAITDIITFGRIAGKNVAGN